MDSDELSLEAYKLKLDYLTSQFDRLWARFNFFLTIQVGLFGFLGWLLFEKGNPGAVRLPATIGLAVSVLWYVVAAEDRALVEEYRKRTDEAARRIAEAPAAKTGWVGLPHAGEAAKSDPSPGLTSWYSRSFSMTKLPALIALVLVVAWAAILLLGDRLPAAPPS